VGRFNNIRETLSCNKLLYGNLVPFPLQEDVDQQVWIGIDELVMRRIRVSIMNEIDL
jgi:hypothetical protein